MGLLQMLPERVPRAPKAAAGALEPEAPEFRMECQGLPAFSNFLTRRVGPSILGSLNLPQILETFGLLPCGCDRRRLMPMGFLSRLTTALKPAALYPYPGRAAVSRMKPLIIIYGSTGTGKSDVSACASALSASAHRKWLTFSPACRRAGNKIQRRDHKRGRDAAV
jgi:hypothetical protein